MLIVKGESSAYGIRTINPAILLISIRQPGFLHHISIPKYPEEATRDQALRENVWGRVYLLCFLFFVTAQRAHCRLSVRAGVLTGACA